MMRISNKKRSFDEFEDEEPVFDYDTTVMKLRKKLKDQSHKPHTSFVVRGPTIDFSTSYLPNDMPLGEGTLELYMGSRGLKKEEHKFVYNGKEISWEDTPEGLKMKDNDTIQVIALPFPNKPVAIFIMDKEEGEGIEHKAPKEEKMGEAFLAFAMFTNIPVHMWKFTFKGKRVDEDETVESLGLVDCDTIEAFLELK